MRERERERERRMEIKDNTHLKLNGKYFLAPDLEKSSSQQQTIHHLYHPSPFTSPLLTVLYVNPPYPSPATLHSKFPLLNLKIIHHNPETQKAIRIAALDKAKSKISKHIKAEMKCRTKKTTKRNPKTVNQQNSIKAIRNNKR